MSMNNHDRFWRKTVYVHSGCCLWIGSASKHGYGTFGIGSRTDGSRRTVRTTRYAYEISFGPIPDGLYVLHKCDNPRCVNPDHLYLGDQKKNMQDMRERGRSNYVRGEKIGLSKLNEKQIAEIRSMNIPNTLIARKFDVTPATIGYIRNGKTWKHCHVD